MNEWGRDFALSTRSCTTDDWLSVDILKDTQHSREGTYLNMAFNAGNFSRRSCCNNFIFFSYDSFKVYAA